MKKLIYTVCMFFAVNLYADLLNVHGVYLDNDSGVWVLCSGNKGKSWQQTLASVSPSVSLKQDQPFPSSRYPLAKEIVFVLDSRERPLLDEKAMYQQLLDNKDLFGQNDKVGVLSFGTESATNRAVRSHLSPTTDRTQWKSALDSYGTPILSGPDHSIRAVKEALSTLRRSSANAERREAVILVLHKMPDRGVDLKNALSEVPEGNAGMKVPIFALVLGDRSKLSPEWIDFFEETGGAVVCSEEKTPEAFMVGVKALLTAWDAQQGYLYVRNDSLDSNSLTRGLNITYPVRTKAGNYDATVNVPLSFQDRPDVLSKRLQGAIAEKNREWSQGGAGGASLFDQLQKNLANGDYDAAHKVAVRVKDLLAEEGRLLDSAIRCEEGKPAPNQIDYRLAQQENQNNASRANQYLLLINELKKAQSLAHQGRGEEAATAYADVIKNPELPVAEKARILFSMPDANATYGGQGIALIESAAISGEVFPTPLMQSYAKALLQVGRYEDAEETAFEILGNRSDADSAQMNFVLGVALYKQGQVNQAATYIGRAVAVNPKYQQMFKDALSN